MLTGKRMKLRMLAKVVHGDINAGGGSERLAVATIDLLNEMGFKVDIASFKKPDIEQLKKDFGDIVNPVDINAFKPLNLFSMLDLTTATAVNNRSNEVAGVIQGMPGAYGNDSEYYLIINTHGDLLPYYDHSQTQVSGSNDDDDVNVIASNKKVITYCHFPLAPQLIEQDHNDNNGYTRFIKRWIGIENLDSNEDLKQRILENVSKVYDLMMRNTIVLTNSNFSKRAIEERYSAGIKPIVVYPPVDVEKFRKAALHSSKRENAILVVSRFSPDKQIENAIDISKILFKDMHMQARTVLVGNIASADEQYLDKIKQLIKDYDLENGSNNNVHIEVDASFDRLLELMRESKVYLHPLPGEPFGISVVEAMSAGLIPVVPDEGGYTEFVPEHYQFHTHEQAADIIGKILIASDNSLQSERTKISESISKFSTESYKAALRNVIESLISPPS